ncbi:uncharacterized protein PGTG_14475 [Puccinia graminis f. sp. tritici CRL 75-36-700-3]|uniref:DUF6533 domain-containing protein n=1 Tax=Puccinia graminis f. sp. tritici (strain CRL 75-36-700-3 / race SCCL) TaxID=418459 RepID=E3KVQ1_PUCGT|nr:uncharacterized protein PGTG_14475 [Puccinia graminis f. sp. tritici CRL 75-36-700-3]EFP88391.1 hypothetical protein PGTG_14475 [Puccinia graminis f. sp. tritici CRL 75-36-700-3]
MYAVALWDWIICLPKEYRRIYKAPRSLIKVLYYFNRYYTLANLLFVLYGFNAQMTTAECDKFYKWEPGVASFTTIFAEAILVVRTYALWGRNKYILAVLLTGLTIECVVLFFAVTQFHAVPTRDPTDPTSRGACIAGGGPGGHDWSMAYWVSPIVMDTLMLILTSIRVGQPALHSQFIQIADLPLLKQALQYRNKGVKSSVFQTFVKDGILYFVVVFGVNLINTIFYSLPSPALQAINSPMSLLMTSIMCSHIVLSLRGEEKEEMEAVSKDWQVNTFLKKKKEQRSGATATQEKNSAHHHEFNNEGIYRNGINMHPFSISAPSAQHPSDTYSASLDMNSSGLIPSEGFMNPTYEGVQVDIEHGRNYDEEKSAINDSQTKLEVLSKS